MKQKLASVLNSLLLAFLFACGGGGVTLLRAADVTAHLTYTYSSTSSVDGSNDWPACSSAVKTLCITGFNLYDITGGARTLLFTISNAATPSGQQTITQTQTVNGFTFGTHTLVATVAYIDSSGTAAEGPDSASAPCVYSPGGKPAVILNSATAK